MNTKDLIRAMDELHPLVQNCLQTECQRMRTAKEKGELANFIEDNYVLMARDHFHEGEKLCLRWCGPWRVTKFLIGYVFQVKDLRSRDTEDVHGTRLKFSADNSLYVDEILSHVFLPRQV